MAEIIISIFTDSDCRDPEMVERSDGRNGPPAHDDEETLREFHRFSGEEFLQKSVDRCAHDCVAATKVSSGDEKYGVREVIDETFDSRETVDERKESTDVNSQHTDQPNGFGSSDGSECDISNNGKKTVTRDNIGHRPDISDAFPIVLDEQADSELRLTERLAKEHVSNSSPQESYHQVLQMCHQLKENCLSVKECVNPCHCNKCGQDFGSEGKFKAHDALFHDGIKHEVIETLYPGDTDKCYQVVKGSSAFQCISCSKCFAIKRNVTDHYNVYHRGMRFECQHCGKKFRERNQLKSHLKVHEGKLSFQCHICGKAFSRRNSCDKHMKNVHVDEKPRAFRIKNVHVDEKAHAFQCTSCFKCYASKHNLTRHYNLSHGEMRFQCQHCGERFRQQHLLTSHLTVHEGKLSFQCPICGKSLTRRQSCKEHMRNVHVDGRPRDFQCTSCSKCFASEHRATRHCNLSHGEMRFICQHCGKRFHQHYKLTSHLTVHEGKLSFQCHICGKAFPRRNACHEHMRNVHVDGKPYVCGEAGCGKGCKSAVALKKHLTCHMIDRPTVNCMVCDKQLSPRNPRSFSSHLAIHLGEKMFQCKVCHKRFRQYSAYKTHVVTHTGEKRYGCPHCPRRYSTRHSLQYHFRKQHTGERPSSDTGTYSVLEGIDVTFDSRETVDEHKESTDVNSEHKDQPNGFGSSDGSECDISNNGKKTMTRNNISHPPNNSNAVPIVLDEEADSELGANDSRLNECRVLNEGLEKEHLSNSSSPQGRHVESYHQGLQMCRQLRENGLAVKECVNPCNSNKCGQDLGSEGKFKAHDALFHEGGIRDEVIEMVNPGDQDKCYRVVKGSSAFQCTSCSKCFAIKRNVTDHYNVFHRDMRFTCQHCGKRFRQRYQLTSHLTVHERKFSIQCHICGKSFSRRNGCDKHMRNVHGDGRPVDGSPRTFRCTSCSKCFASEHNVTRHYNRSHGEMRFQCQHCGKRFPQQNKLTSHLTVHERKLSFQCHICGKAFLRIQTCNNHMRNVHVDGRPYVCGEAGCGKSFKSGQTLKKHLTCHLVDRPAVICMVCDKQLSLQSFYHHLAIHSGERPFQCKVCNQRFQQHSTYSTHLLTHTGEKPHGCPHCLRRYSQRHSLRFHLKKHTGERPFVAACVERIIRK